MDEPTTSGVEAPGSSPGLIAQPHGGAIAPAWTREQASEAARKGNASRKGKAWTWEARAMRYARIRGPDGQRTHDRLLGKLVSLAEEGDVRALELFAKLSGWRPETVKNHVHGVSGDIMSRLRIESDGDKRGQVVDVVAVTTPALMHGSDSVQGDGRAEGEQPGSVDAQAEQPSPPSSSAERPPAPEFDCST